jgi:hypothetical protein
MNRTATIAVVVASVAVAYLGWQLYLVTADPNVKAALALAGKAGGVVDAFGGLATTIDRTVADAGAAVGGAADAIAGAVDKAKSWGEHFPIWGA